ncbi:Exopolysaccharide biosynthesis protein related to N-acetylglucosamine-1-phosphodiester alpha-N-acetylglucosaminidase [Candidatus Rubidus massiliensis]|nr:Exopolysaccharide biosynthesis protein related to N-acetylglucosamine-1-phosphodiester alpha-N-acetylglucosaminidase [Candidatus Rubidus massiliensis]
MLLIPSLQAREGMFLTWQSDPCTTMTISWLSKSPQPQELRFHQIDSNDWFYQFSLVKPLPDNLPFYLHRVELIELQPDSSYAFTIDNDQNLSKFKTLPSQLNQTLRFVVGGDMYNEEDTSVFKKMNLQAAKTNPSFVLIGGDIAYSGRKLWFLQEKGLRWIEWLKAWDETMITTDGFLIPLLPVIGNHETNGRFGQTPNQAKFFYTLFPMPGLPGYNVVDIGDYLSIFLLDSGHTNAIGQFQSAWLEQALQKRKDKQHKFAVYHVPAYPSRGSYVFKQSSLIRRYWVPLFDRYHLDIAFEHHCHTYKRTYALKNNQLDSNGTVYLGDGAWSIDNVRKVNLDKKHWFLAEAKSINHFILAEITQERRDFKAIDGNGNAFDFYQMILPKKG